MLIRNKNKTIAIVAGLLLGLGALVFLGLGLFACHFWFGSLNSTCGGAAFYSVLGFLGVGAFASANRTKRIAATVGYTHIAIVFTSLVAGYLALLAGGRGDGVGFFLLGDFIFALPITALSAWLGARVSRRRNMDST